jgi:predicted nucleic acid-binding protein
MTVFVDATALFALLDEDDAHHAEAAATFTSLAGTELMTHTFVVAEAAALVANHLPWAATQQLLYGLLPVIDVKPIESVLYDAALGNYGQSTSPAVSLVDRTSFALMRSQGIRRAFAYDEDFSREGFELVA